MQVTNRDLEIMRFINRFKYATVRHVMKAFEMNEKAAYRRLAALVGEGYLRYKKIFVGRPGIYWLTQDGADLAGDELPPLRKIQFSTLNHDLAVIDISLALQKRFGGEWTTERELLRAAGGKKIGQPGFQHVPDGVLTMKDGAQVAVEVEMSAKPPARLKKILGFYAGKLDYAEVWYIVSNPGLRQRINDCSAHLNFVRVFMFEEVLEDVRKYRYSI
ncbi:replication-relaxation family protein [Thermincola ferriacetica]